MESFNAVWDKVGTPVTYLIWGYLIWCVVVGALAIGIFIFILSQFRDMNKGFDSKFFKRNRR
jgi:hypothetical protein